VEIVERKRTIPLIKHIPLLRAMEDIVQNKKNLKEYGSADLIHVHYASRLNIFLLPFFKKSGTRTIVTYWGSDLLRRGKRYVKSLRPFLAYADIITFNSMELIALFNQMFRNKFAGKIVNVKFGISMFEYINENEDQESIRDAKEKIHLPQDKIIVVCGHTRAKEHRQLEVLKQIQTMDQSLLQGLCIVFPMTYGSADEKYEQELEALSKKLPCPVHFYREYMSEEDIARLRRVTDIFIHAQKTDAFSATLQEFLYAGSLVLNGSWLKYPDLRTAGIEYFEFDDIRDIPAKLQTVILQFEALKNAMKANRKKIHQLSAWETVADEWLKLYKH